MADEEFRTMEQVKQARKLRELFKGRFSEREAQELLNQHGSLPEAVEFVLSGDPSEVRRFINDRNQALVTSLRRDSEYVNAALQEGLTSSIRLFACEPCDRYWWRKVPARKEVSKCKVCREKYDPVPREEEWGLGHFVCVCTNEFWGSAWMNHTQSPCYKCGFQASPRSIRPPTRRQEQRPPRSRHSCTGSNCYNRARGTPAFNSVKQHVEREVAAAPCDAKYLNVSEHHTRCLKDNENATLVPMTNSMKRAILRLHNDLRADTDPPASNMMKLRWNDRLAKSAEKWMMQCKPYHDQMNDRMEPDWPRVMIGQNIGLGHRNFKIMIEKFHEEKFTTNYTYGGPYVKGSGHYVQLVSWETTRVGCAVVKCPHTIFKIFRACNYAPSLNARDADYRNGSQCRDCPDHCVTSGRYAGKLCGCKGKLCYNGGTLDPSTCICLCQAGKTGENCEKVDCDSPDPLGSCVSGRLNRTDCGKRGTLVHDPAMCPHLCGLCPKLCGGVECKNGGKLNVDTCQCTCPGRLTGPTCEQCPSKDEDYCTKFLPRDQCHKLKRGDCPIYCGFCHTQCAPCENYGDLNTDDCTCTCKGGFKGDRCEICPENDQTYCPMMSTALCTKTPYQFSIWHTRCPYHCGVCQRT